MSTPPEAIIEEIQSLYRSDSLPWIVGYSGGKDSTASLQLIWKAVATLPAEQRTKDIHVISTDTLVENPVIAACSGQLIPDTVLSFSSALAGASPSLN